MDLMATNVSKLIRDIKTGGRLCCNDHALVVFAVLRDMGWVVRLMNFRKTDFQLLKDIRKGSPRDKGVE